MTTMRTSKRRSRRARRNEKTEYMIITAVLVIMTICAYAYCIRLNKVNNFYVPEGMYRYYAVVEVSDGDTIWDIASDIKSKYNMDEVTTKSIVNQIRSINHKSDKIKSGDILYVPYYSAEYVK